MPRFPGDGYRDEPTVQPEDLHDVAVHDVSLGPDGGGGVPVGSGRSYNDDKRKKWYKNPIVWASACLCLVIIGIVGTIVALAGDGDSEPKVGVQLPGPDVDADTAASNRNAFTQVLMARYNDKGMDWSTVSNPESFQGRALEYVIGSELYAQLSEDENVERYAAVVFYLSTFRQPHLLTSEVDKWNRSNGWTTKQSLCVWEGVQCNGDNRLVGLILPENNLSGSLPLELALFDQFDKFDFSSNLIYMDEDYHELWTLLPNLRELVMDDNYFISETGIPQEFSGLQSIEKISLSFNLLQGNFDDDVFGTIPTLIHFEAESNYIQGPFPDTMLKMPNLTYIYVRRNSLTMPLSDILLPGNLPSLFALWLDGNEITGDIPQEIGSFSGIASLSITDAGLTGPLPTQMGQLVDLQRLWLYNNELSGPIPTSAAQAWTKLEVFEVYGNKFIGAMPASICSSVQSSDYAFATLTADCDEITCELGTCCTQCY